MSTGKENKRFNSGRSDGLPLLWRNTWEINPKGQELDLVFGWKVPVHGILASLCLHMWVHSILEYIVMGNTAYAGGGTPGRAHRLPSEGLEAKRKTN